MKMVENLLEISLSAEKACLRLRWVVIPAAIVVVVELWVDAGVAQLLKVAAREVVEVGHLITGHKVEVDAHECPRAREGEHRVSTEFQVGELALEHAVPDVAVRVLVKHSLHAERQRVGTVMTDDATKAARGRVL